SKGSPLTITVSTRDQKELKLLEVDIHTGKCGTLLSETDKAWNNLHKNMPAWLDDGNSFLWISEHDGAPQLELHDKKGKLLRVLAGPHSGFSDYIDADAGKGMVYYRASLDPS